MNKVFVLIAAAIVTAALITTLHQAHGSPETTIDSVKAESVKLVTTLIRDTPYTVTVVRDSSVSSTGDPNSTQSYYYDARYTFQSIPTRQMQTALTNDGWTADTQSGATPYLKNDNYKYCHDMLVVTDTTITTHCFKVD